MRLVHHHPGMPLGVVRDEVVVCVVGDAVDAGFHATLDSVAAHTPANVPLVLACAEVAPEKRRDVEARAGDRAAIWLPGANTADVLAISAPADAAIVRAGSRVSEGWLEGLQAAGRRDAITATASPLVTELLIPRGVPNGEFERYAELVRRRSLRLRPRTDAILEACFFARRSALELLGGWSGEFGHRCLDRGLCHVIADDVLVDAVDQGPDALPGWRSAAGDIAHPLRRAISRARRAVSGLSVAIDARDLRGPMTGTQIHTLELIGAIARTERAHVTALLPHDLGPDASAALRDVPGLQTLAAPVDGRPLPLVADLVHRPYQVSTPADLAFVAQAADRLVLTHQDLIGYHNPAYYRSREAWDGYRRITQAALAMADRVVFMSEYVLCEALAEDLIEPDRACAIPIGVDHVITPSRVPAVGPPALSDLVDGQELMLCLGTDLQHKNRPFALRIASDLQRRHGWAGCLVFAGKHVELGASADEESLALGTDPALAAAVRDIGPVSEAEKEWLLARARLVLYPTVHEGFGLIPFEAAAHGVPCLWAAGTALGELLPEAEAGITAWDAAASSDRAIALMRDPTARERNLAAITATGSALRWDLTAERLVDQYEAACDGPGAPVAKRERAQGLMREGLSEDALRLVGPGGALPDDVVRPLLALANHRRVGSPVFRLLRGGYRATQRRRAAGPERG